MSNIGFVGLGHMGLPMAINLMQAGYRVKAFDLNANAIDAWKEAKGTPCQSLKELAIDQDILITMLQTGDQVRDVCVSELGLFKHAKPGTLHIDCSSIDVLSARAIHRAANDCGLLSVDAPVSGGVAGAKSKTLTFMVGGESFAFDRAKPILESMGQKIISTGDSGSGQAAKICNNMILGATMIAISEAFLLAESLGLSDKKLFEVVNNASGQCWAMSKYVPVPGVLENVPANNQYQPGFTSKMMLKDLGLSQNAAAISGVNTPISAKAQAMYQELVDKGLGDLDFSAIITMLQS